MTYLIWLLRIIHIGAGIVWVGGTLVMTFFIAPSTGATAEAGQKFLRQLMFPMKFGQKMAAAAGLTILAGGILYWIDSDGFTSAWMSSGAGAGFGIGALFAIIGFVFGILIGRNTRALIQLREKTEGKPSNEQMMQMQELGKQLKIYSYTASGSLILSVIFMAIARYFVF
ncbi:MAG: hypothetical protein IT313_10270 [Anaerolineales bacterium]|nr:hypothetical protein [Anaerolineales bacterium]